MTTRSHGSQTRANLQKGESVTWVGSSCGRHGSYSFYKAFRFRISGGSRQPASTSSVVVRSRGARERRNHCDADIARHNGKENQDNKDSDAAEERILALGEFFFVQCRPEDPVCIGELQLLWNDKHSEQDLASMRLYYLPETTPAGRTSTHGEDEVLAVSEKIVMRVNDLALWIVEPAEWNYGSSLPLAPAPTKDCRVPPITAKLPVRSSVNMHDVMTKKEALLLSANGLCPIHHDTERAIRSGKKNHLDQESNLVHGDSFRSRTETTESVKQCALCLKRHRAQVLVLSMSSYCRHKAIMKRIEGKERQWFARAGTHQLLSALGVFTAENPKTRIVFCRDTFDYPQLFEHDLICEELSPVFKGRPRKKTKKSSNVALHKLSSRTNNSAGEIPNNGINAEKVDSLTDKDIEVFSTRRSSSRRRSKRKSPQTTAYFDERSFVSPRCLKRTRQSRARTPTLNGEASEEKVDSSRDSSSPTPEVNDTFTSTKTIAQTIDAVAQTAVGRTLKNRSKKLSGPKSFAGALSLKLMKNSLGNQEEEPFQSNSTSVGDPEQDTKRKRSSTSSTSPSASPTSSRSSSPLTELLLENPNPSVLKDTHSLSESLDSNASSLNSEPYVLSSPTLSPLDFSAIMSVADEPTLKQDLELLASEENMQLRQLIDGRIPENKTEFLELLHQFMRKRNTPIGRIPSLGFKKLDLWAFFKLSQEYGGYDMVTAKRLWKHVYDRMGGNPSCTSAATCTRKHFEKLLLPLETCLRQTLRKKEAESQKKDSPDEKKKQLDLFKEITPLNGRTFNGEAYFQNGAKINNVSNSTDVNVPVTTFAPESCPPTDVSDTTAVDSAVRTDTETALSATSQACVTSTAISPALGFNFQSLAHSVIQDEMMNKRKTPDVKAESNPHDLSCSSKPLRSPLGFTILPSSSQAQSEVIDLTEGDQSPRSVTPTVGLNQKLYFNPTPPPPVSLSIHSRTHCPRVNGAPPPFVPTKSSRSIDPTERPRPAEVRPTALISSIQALIPEKVKTNPDAVMGVSRIQQKRHSREMKLEYLPTSPKRSCPAPTLANNRTSPNIRRYDIRNLVSLTPEDTKSRHHDIHETKMGFRQHPALQRWEDSRCPPGKDVSSSLYNERQLDPQQLQEELRKMKMIQEVDRPRSITHSEYIPEGRKPSSHCYQPSEESSRGRERSYYRPNGMLATHREAAKHQTVSVHETPRSESLKSDRISDHASMSERFIKQRPHLHSEETPVNGLRPPSIRELHHSNCLPLAASPKVTPHGSIAVSPSTGKPFSSSFCIDRLTQDTQKHQPARNGFVTPMGQREVVKAPFPTPPTLPKPYPHHLAYADRRTISCSSSSDKNNVKSHHNVQALPRRLDNGVTYLQERTQWEARKESHPGSNRSDSVLGKAVPSPEGKIPPQTQAILDSLQPAVARTIYPFIPKDCTPMMLDTLLQTLAKTIPLAPMGGIPFSHLPIPGLQEALLQQRVSEQPFHVMSREEQRVSAAAQLARVNMLGNPPGHHGPTPDQVAMASMYQAYTSHLASFHQNASRRIADPVVLGALNTPNKHFANVDMLTRAARQGGPLVHGLRNPGFLTAPAQFVSHLPPEIAATLAYSSARR